MKHRVRRIAVAIVAVTAVLGSGLAHAAKVPRALETDRRVREVRYDPNQVYEVTSTYGYTTTIEFGANERILNSALGDTIGFEVGKFRNHLVLKPVEADAQTNLTVTTSAHVYYFHLTSSRSAAGAVYVVRFIYPDNGDLGDVGSGDGNGSGYAAGGDMQPRVVNRDYQVSGDERSFGLQRVFDDGQFTYFLTVGNKPKPMIYVVQSDGTEALANTRREGPYLVVEQMADRFTLRDGPNVLCVARTSHAGAMSGLSNDNGRVQR
ncbi:type VI secretion protein [Trinickia violacea]|uniref:Type VI secretion protein n=1 Tax=Trinickia violacea TaxID=2571746 RepID=A0A4P8J4S8_9BURK|nr:TrbG/VirB9 family P-type conjugative transfer protein [Trinickia violacea]QCP55124.1 type VI secretion protein [Trinickia violacea]